MQQSIDFSLGSAAAAAAAAVVLFADLVCDCDAMLANSCEVQFSSETHNNGMDNMKKNRINERYIWHGNRLLSVLVCVCV